ncbi:MAG: hypothetical protein JWP58_2733 [Hymenobacter sp.]|nr:hypothetical protein [Hymenobacter sp.]
MSEPHYPHANAAPLAVRLQLAQDPATLPLQLEALGDGVNSRAIKEAVARNPNSPPALLLRLAGRYWQPFLENPVLPLLLLEDPGLPHRLPLRVLRALVRREGVPPLILQTLARHADREVREGAKFHVDTLASPAANEAADWQATLRRELEKLPAQRATLPELLDLDVVPAWLLDTLAGTRNPALRGALLTSSKRADAAPELRAVGSLLRRAYGERRTEPYVSKYGSYDQTWVEGREPLTEAEVRRLATGSLAWQLRVVQQRSLPADVLAQLARSPYPQVRRLVAGHPQLTPALALTLAGGPDAAIRQRLAANKRTPEALLTSLARSPDADLRRRVARNPATSPAALATLATDADPAVRRAAARHRTTPPAALAPLTTDPSAEVREALARNAQCPLAALEQLGADADKKVRQAVADSARLPQALHMALLVDPSSRVRHHAAFNRRTPYHLMHYSHDHGGNPPAERPPFPAWDLTQPWRQHQDQRHREKVAKAAADRRARQLPPLPPAPPVPPADEAHINRVYRGEYTPADLAEWAASPTAGLRAALCYHLEDLDMLRRLADDPVAKVRAAAAHNPRMPAEVLARLALDRRAAVRQHVGSNANTPPEVLAVLAQDRLHAVRDYVAYNKATPPAALAGIAARPRFGPKMRRRLLQNESTPPELLTAWYVDASRNTRHTLAGNPNTPVELLREIARRDDAPDTWDALATNRSTPPDLIAWLWQKPREHGKYLHHHLTEHPNISDELLQEAVAFPDPGSASYVAKNPRLTPELFRQLLPFITHKTTKDYLLYGDKGPAFIRDILLEENDPEIIKTMARLKDTPVAVLLELARRIPANRYDNSLAYTLAYNKAAPIEVLEALFDTWTAFDAGDAPWWYCYLAENPNATTELLEKILELLLAQAQRKSSRYHSASIDDNTAFSLVSNPRLAPEHLHHFAEHPNREVRYALLQRPDCPPELKPVMRAAALRRNLEKGTSVLGRASAVADAATSAEWLAWLLPKAGWVERLAMIENPNLPAEMLETLAQDAHRLVRAAARQRQATGQVPDLMQ